MGDFVASRLLFCYSAKKPGGNSFDAGPDIFRIKFLLILLRVTGARLPEAKIDFWLSCGTPTRCRLRSRLLYCFV